MKRIDSARGIWNDANYSGREANAKFIHRAAGMYRRRYDSFLIGCLELPLHGDIQFFCAG